MLTRKKNEMPFFMIPGQSAREVFDTSIVPEIHDAGTQLVEMDKWLADNGIESGLRFRIDVCCEEIMKNIVEHAGKIARKAPSVDVRIALKSEGVTAVIHDAGTPFNPIENDPKTGLGLLIVKKSCDDMKYEFMFNQNILTMSWHGTRCGDEEVAPTSKLSDYKKS